MDSFPSQDKPHESSISIDATTWFPEADLERIQAVADAEFGKNQAAGARVVASVSRRGDSPVVGGSSDADVADPFSQKTRARRRGSDVMKKRHVEEEGGVGLMLERGVRKE